jgi:hypothetical protein
MKKYVFKTGEKRLKFRKTTRFWPVFAGVVWGFSAECTKYREQMFSSIFISNYGKKWKTKRKNTQKFKERGMSRGRNVKKTPNFRAGTAKKTRVFRRGVAGCARGESTGKFVQRHQKRTVSIG